MLKITRQRADISRDFVDALQTVSKKYLLEKKEAIELTPRLKGMILSENRVGLAAHSHILYEKDALDMELTKLRNIGYEAFEVITIPAFKLDDYYVFNETTYLAGTTGDVICQSTVEKYSMGNYRVMVPFSVIGLAKSDADKEFQFIPLRDEFTYHRFFHHTSDQFNRRGEDHPEQMGGRTCWGNFDATNVLRTRIISDLFRFLRSYLSVVNMNSLATHNVSHHRIVQ